MPSIWNPDEGISPPFGLKVTPIDPRVYQDWLKSPFNFDKATNPNALTPPVPGTPEEWGLNPIGEIVPPPSIPEISPPAMVSPPMSSPQITPPSSLSLESLGAAAASPAASPSSLADNWASMFGDGLGNGLMNPKRKDRFGIVTTQ